MPSTLPRSVAAAVFSPCASGTAGCVLDDRQFADLPSLVRAGDLLVFNDTRVIKARFFGNKESGGRVEVVLERILNNRQALCQIRASKAPKTGTRLRLADAFDVVMSGRAGSDNDLFVLDLIDQDNFWEVAETWGQLPLPPYIEHPADAGDETRYQTVYARAPGAVAAPDCRPALQSGHAGKPRPARHCQRLRHPARRRRHLLARCACTTSPNTACTASATRFRQPPLPPSPPPVPAADGSSRSAPPACGRWNQPAQADGTLIAGNGDTDIFITPGYRSR